MTEVANEGLSLNYAMEGKGSPPIVFIHGLGGTLHDFEYICFHLKTKHRILRMDLRGFGESDKPLLPQYSNELWASDVYQLMEALKMKEAFLCGHSSGARIAACFAHLYPEITKGLILLNMTPWGADPEAAIKLEEMAKDVVDRGMEVALGMVPSFNHPRTEKKVIDELLANNPKAFAMGLKVAADDFKNKQPQSFYEKIRAASLVLVSDKDSMPLKSNLELKNQLPLSSMAMIPNCNHYSMLDQPHLVLEVIQRYLFETLSSSA